MIARVAVCWFVLMLAVAPAGAQRVDESLMKKIVKEADFEFANHLMYRRQSAWIGKTIAFRATIHAKPVIMAEDKEYIQVSGSSSSGEPVELVAFLDTPLPTPRGIEDNAPTVSRGQVVYVFGVLQKCRDFIDRAGYVRFLPTMECLLLFDRDDREFRRPLWSSRTLRQ